MSNPLIVYSTVKLTSTTSSQTTNVPSGAASLCVYNAGANTVWFAMAATVAVPATGTWTSAVVAVQPATTQVFNVGGGGGTLAYIAETAGGDLILSVGFGT